MNNEKELTAKEEAFCVAYTTIGSETFSNGAKSAIEADYAENSARTQAWRMLRKEHIKERIRELFDKNMEENIVTVGSVLANLAHDRLMARKHDQYSVAKSCTELEGKYLAMFTENINQTIEEPREFSEEESAILREAAAKMNKLDLKMHEPGYGETPEDNRREIAERNVG
ncbi:MAG: terminase small subunit [Planctomycetota bacterium]|jgi:phage terminase small subunit